MRELTADIDVLTFTVDSSVVLAEFDGIGAALCGRRRSISSVVAAQDLSDTVGTVSRGH